MQQYSCRIFFILFLSALFLLQPIHVHATNTTAAPRNISDAQWQQLTNDSTWAYKNEKEHIIKPEPKRNDFLIKALQSIYIFFTSTLGQVIIWGTLFIVLGYAVYRIIINEKAFLFSRKRKVNVGEKDEAGEEDLTAINWEAQLQKAINESDLRLAVRYSYMLLLKLLQERDLITYSSDKTNLEYYSELTNSAYKQPFKQLSRQYEYAWYGNFGLSAAAYDEYMNTFNQVKKQLYTS